MKKLMTWAVMMLMVALMPMTTSCGDDDDENVALSSYIIGNWRCFRLTYYYGGQTESRDLTKTGELSAAYYEMSFKNSWNVVFKYWEQDTYGTKHWVEENGKYVIKGDIVSVNDSEGHTYDFLFDPKEKTLCIQSSAPINGATLKANVYLRK